MKRHTTVGPSFLKLQRQGAIMGSSHYLPSMYTSALSDMARQSPSTANSMPDVNPKALEAMLGRSLITADYATPDTPQQVEVSPVQPYQSKIKKTLSTLGAIVGMMLGTIGYNARAEADCPMGVPVPGGLPTLMESHPDFSFLRPVNGQGQSLYGNFTGAHGSTDSSKVWISTDGGFLLEYDFGVLSAPTLLRAVNTGYTGATGVTVKPDQTMVVSRAGTLFYGSVTGNTWNEASSKDLDISNIQDVKYAFGNLFVALNTSNSTSVRRVNETTGITTPIVNSPTGNIKSIVYLDWLPNSFCNPVLQFEPGSNNFKNADYTGGTSGTSQFVNFNGSSTMQGAAYYRQSNGSLGLARAQGIVMDLHDDDELMPFIEEIAPAESSKGDLNCDGAVNMADVEPFAQALTNPSSYIENYSQCNIENADMNLDGNVNGKDINEFLAKLGL